VVIPIDDAFVSLQKSAFAFRLFPLALQSLAPQPIYLIAVVIDRVSTSFLSL